MQQPTSYLLAAAGPTEAVALVEQITRLGIAGVAFLLILALMRGWLVTAIRHSEAIEGLERLLSEKDEEITRLVEDRNWWKDATVTALQIGETVAGRTSGPGSR